MPYPYFPNYNGWNPTSQAPIFAPQPPSVAPQTAQPTNDINWVQGEADAKSRPVAAGHSVILMDTEQSVMYIKTVDQSGMPQPLRIFDYKEREPQGRPAGAINNPVPDAVTREEFNALADRVDKMIKGEGEG